MIRTRLSNAQAIIGVALVGLMAGPAANGQNAAIPRINTAPAGLGFPQIATVPRITSLAGPSLGQVTPAFGGASTRPIGVPTLYPDVVPTDPLVRQIQVGSTPIGVLDDADLTRGIGTVNVPGAGGRVVRTIGSVIQTTAGPAVRVIDAATGVEFLALVPEPRAQATDPGPLVPAKVVKVSGESVILEREENGRTLTEILPSARVYAAIRGGLVPAASVRRLRPGVEVFIPATGGPRGTIIVTRPSGFGTRASSASTTPESR